jgi:ribokinase
VSVTVVGSLNEDVLVSVGRLPGRGETVVGRSAVVAAGGKGANQAAAAGRLGPGVHMVGRVGADPAGDRQLAALAESRVNVTLVRRTPGVPTGSATIPVEEGSGENLIVVVPGANAELRPEDADAHSVRRATVLLLQLEVPMATVEAAALAATGTVVLTPAPPQPLPAGLLDRVDVLVPNEHELAELAGAPPGNRSVADLARLARSVAACSVVVTLGARGALVLPAPDGPVTLQPPPPVTPVDTTGAGPGRGPARGGALCGRRGCAVHHRSGRPRRVARPRRRAGAATAGAAGRTGGLSGVLRRRAAGHRPEDDVPRRLP